MNLEQVDTQLNAFIPVPLTGTIRSILAWAQK